MTALQYKVIWEIGPTPDRPGMKGSNLVWVTNRHQIHRAMLDQLRTMGIYGIQPSQLTIVKTEYTGTLID